MFESFLLWGSAIPRSSMIYLRDRSKHEKKSIAICDRTMPVRRTRAKNALLGTSALPNGNGLRPSAYKRVTQSLLNNNDCQPKMIVKASFSLPCFYVPFVNKILNTLSHIKQWEHAEALLLRNTHGSIDFDCLLSLERNCGIGRGAGDFSEFPLGRI